VAEVRGPAALEDLQLERYHVFHAIPADLLRRLEHYVDAAAAYEAALERTENAAERRFLEAQARAGTRTAHLLIPRPVVRRPPESRCHRATAYLVFTAESDRRR
jgi:hypothetical protein